MSWDYHRNGDALISRAGRVQPIELLCRAWKLFASPRQMPRLLAKKENERKTHYDSMRPSRASIITSRWLTLYPSPECSRPK
jgi:hypothetical protein